MADDASFVCSVYVDFEWIKYFLMYQGFLWSPCRFPYRMFWTYQEMLLQASGLRQFPYKH